MAGLLRETTGAVVSSDDIRTIASGASGRAVMRWHDGARPYLGIFWTADRADNNSFLPAARHLLASGVRVPRVLAEKCLGVGVGVCLVDDLGDDSLLSAKEADWEVVRSRYRAAFREVLALHASGAPASWELQPAFDEGLYLWEQGYFAEFYLGRHLGRDAAAFCLLPAMRDMAVHLAEYPRCPVHRDCQSQNILFRDGCAWLIDFQGMRLGLPEYDVASLVYDPYMGLAAARRAVLLRDWEDVSGSPLDRDRLAGCALQRIMQAMGAFANIGHNQGRAWYLEQIPPALEALRQVCAMEGVSPWVQRVFSCLRSEKVL